MKLVELVLRRGQQGRGRMMEGVRYIVRTYVNITMYPTIQILYANEIIKINKESRLQKPSLEILIRSLSPSCMLGNQKNYNCHYCKLIF
jgi:hypothetical protein